VVVSSLDGIGCERASLSVAVSTGDEGSESGSLSAMAKIPLQQKSSTTAALAIMTAFQAAPSSDQVLERRCSGPSADG
jgi:hypothetical protein